MSRWGDKRELNKWRRQRPRQRHKSMTWLLEWEKIIVLHVRPLFDAIFWRSLSNDVVKFSYLRFWRQRELAALNLSFFAFAWKTFVPSKRKWTSPILYITWPTWNHRKTLNITQRSIFTWRFRCNRRRSFLNSLNIVNARAARCTLFSH